MNANLGTIETAPSRVVVMNHPPITESIGVLEDEGVIADGQIVAKDDDGKVIAHEKVTGAAMTGTVNGTNDDFTATLDPIPVLPGSVRIDNNNTSAQVVTDDGHGKLIGDGSGTVNYATGAVVVALTTPPANGKTVLISHKTKPVGVNVQECDTADDDTALVLRHGTVNADLLLTGSSAPDAEDIAALEDIGIYAV
jgi:hypothetical protein